MIDKLFNEAAKRRKIEQARQERVAAEQAAKVRQEREAAKKRPHCQRSEQAMDKLCQRIIARATAHKRAAENLRWGISGGPAAPVAARVSWTAAVELAATECGGDRMKAVALANRRHPGLRERLVREAN